MTTLKQIREFLASEPIALIGVSRNPRKFGFMAFKELKEKGMNVVPVNRHASEIYQSRVFPDIKSLPAETRGLIIMTKKNETAAIVKEAKSNGFKYIWIQQGSESDEALRELEGTDINFITNQCILMYYKPNSIHKFHAGLKKFFGRYPK
jgi:uncharacterized protein